MNDAVLQLRPQALVLEVLADQYQPALALARPLRRNQNTTYFEILKLEKKQSNFDIQALDTFLLPNVKEGE